MKIIMYHNVKNYDQKLPYQNFLSIKKFKKQLKFFKDKYGLISNKNEIYKKNKKVLLTFDDGLKHHYEIAKILKKKNILGIFFICTKPLIDKIVLPVHKTHIILSSIKSSLALNYLTEMILKNKIILNNKFKIRFKDPYSHQNDELSKKIFKKIMNYLIDNEDKNIVLDSIIDKFKLKNKLVKYYLNSKEIKMMHEMGMVIGSHGFSHNLLSKMKKKEQEKELESSKNMLENIIKDNVTFFCYPYGGSKSYNKNTLELLKKKKYMLSFDVNPKDVDFPIIKKNPFKIPRYDCNLFKL